MVSIHVLYGKPYSQLYSVAHICSARTQHTVFAHQFLFSNVGASCLANLASSQHAIMLHSDVWRFSIIFNLPCNLPWSMVAA